MFLFKHYIKKYEIIIKTRIYIKNALLILLDIDIIEYL